MIASKPPGPNKRTILIGKHQDLIRDLLYVYVYAYIYRKCQMRTIVIENHHNLLY